MRRNLLVLLLFFLTETVVAQNRDSIYTLSFKINKVEYNYRNQAYFIKAKSKQTNEKFLILSPLCTQENPEGDLKRIRKGMTVKLRIEYLNKFPLLSGSPGVYYVRNKKFFLQEKELWYGEVIAVLNLYGRYYEPLFLNGRHSNVIKKQNRQLNNVVPCNKTTKKELKMSLKRYIHLYNKEQ